MQLSHSLEWKGGGEGDIKTNENTADQITLVTWWSRYNRLKSGDLQYHVIWDIPREFDFQINEVAKKSCPYVLLLFKYEIL